MWCDKKSLYLWDLIASTHNPSLIMRKTGDKTQQRGMTRIPENCQGHEKQGKCEILWHPRGAEGDMATKFNVVPWVSAWERKAAVGKN